MILQNLKTRKACRLMLGMLLLSGAVFTLDSCRKEDLTPITIPEKSFEITELEIRSANIDSSRIFWTQKLGFPMIDSTLNTVTIQVGTSRLKYNRINPDFDPTPINHFAIRIPKNQIESALDWLKNEGGKYPNGPKTAVKIIRDELTGAEIIQNPIYNTSSIYIEDDAKNIIELVAHRDFGTEQEGDFSKEQFLNISEVAVVTKMVDQCQDKLQAEFGVQIFPKTTYGYRPIGGQNGAFVVLVPNRIWAPTQTVVSEPFPTTVTIRYPESKTVQLPQKPVSIFTVKTEP